MKEDIKIGTKIKERLLSFIPNPQSELEFNNVFELMIAVMLSAQCTDKRVNTVTKNLFAKYSSPKDYMNLSCEDLEREISSINFYHNKAKNIISACTSLVEKFDGQVPNNHKDLMSLSGVGHKTANVILTVGFGIPALPVDTHVLRVCNRLGLCDTKNPTICENDLKKYISNEKDYGLMHHLLLLFGRYTCTSRNPKCEKCVLKDMCKYKN